MDDLYRDYILEHYKRPHNFGELDPHDLEGLEHNPLCGDELGVHIRVKDGRIEDLRFHGHGCAISQASASIASQELKGMQLEDIGKLDADWMIELLGIPVSATRRKCALLNLKVVRGAVTGDNSWPVSSTEAESPRGSAISNVGDEELAEPVDVEREAIGARDTIPTSEHRILKPTGNEEPHGND